MALSACSALRHSCFEACLFLQVDGRLNVLQKKIAFCCRARYIGIPKGRHESTAAMPLQVPCLILIMFRLPFLHIYLSWVKFTGCFETSNGKSFRNRLCILSDGICISAEFSSACIQEAGEFTKLGNATLLLTKSHKAHRPKLQSAAWLALTAQVEFTLMACLSIGLPLFSIHDRISIANSERSVT